MSDTTLPILTDLVKRGLLQGFDLETIQEMPGEHSREHDRLTLIFPNGEPLVIDTVCSGSLENCGIYIDNATPSLKCDCRCHNVPREGFFHCFDSCKCGRDNAPSNQEPK